MESCESAVALQLSLNGKPKMINNYKINKLNQINEHAWSLVRMVDVGTPKDI